MLYVVSVLLACVVSVQSNNATLSDVRLSPPMVEKPVSTKVEIPELLADTHVVEDPAALLKTLQDTQHKSWEELKTFKVRAWYRYYPNRGSKALTWLAECASTSEQFKQLVFSSNKMMEEAKAGRTYDPVGVDADDEDAWYCRTASIVSPERVVIAMSTKHMRPDNRELLTIFPPDHKTSSLFDWETRQFGFAMPPREFYQKELPKLLTSGGKLVVRKKRELVELDLADPENRRTPRTIYRFDLSKNGSAVISYNRSGIRETEFQNVKNVWVPVSVKEQNINRYIEMDFFDWTVNEEFDQSEFSIKSLPMEEHTVVKDKRVTPPVQTYFRDWDE